MQCCVCEESARDGQWACPSCVGLQVQRRRAVAISSANEKSKVEAKYLAHVHREQARADRINEREQRRWRVQQLQREVQQEQIAVQRGRSRVASLRPFLVDQSRRVEAARLMLAQSVADFNITPEELKQHLAEQQAAAAAAAATASAAAASAAATSTAAIPSPSSSIGGASSVPRPLSLSLPPSTRRWQTNPAFTAKMRRYLEELNAKLAKYRLGLIRSLLDLYVLRRKSNHSCSIVGLELFDDPEEMFDAAAPPPPQEYPQQQQQQQQQQQHPQPVTPLNNNSRPPDPPSVMDGEVVAAGLGYIVLVLHMMSCYLSIRLPYPLRFHGSHSSVSSNDEAATRHYLTLLDNTDPNQFRRAITLLNHNIQYVCDVVGEGLAARQGKMQMARSGTDLQPSAHSGASASAFKLAPLHLLPNMLILIETVTLALKQQMADPHAQQELRLQQARALHQAKTLQRSQELQQQQQQQKQQHPSTAYQAQQQHQQRAQQSPDGALSPHLDGSISQSMVTVHRQDAFPPHHPSSTGPHRAQMAAAARNNNAHNPAGATGAAATASPGTNSHGGFGGSTLPSASPTLSRFDSPPFFSDRALKVASAVGHMSMVATPLSSPSHRGFGSPSYSDGDGARFGLPETDGDAPVHSDLLTPSTFFHLPPNGYMSTEEPRESVLLVRPTQHPQQSQQQQRTPNPASRAPSSSSSAHPSQQVFSFVSPSPGSERSVLDVSHMPSPPPPFGAARVAVSEVAAAMGTSHRALSSTSLSQVQHVQQHPILSPAAMAAAPSFHPDIGDGAAAAAALDLPTAASQFGFLDPSHPLHPSHHQLGGGGVGGDNLGVVLPDALVRASSPRIASSPMHMQQQAVHAQQQQQVHQQQQHRAHASPQSSQHGAGSAPMAMRPPPHAFTPQQMQQQQRDLAQQSAPMQSPGSSGRLVSPLRPSLSPSLPAVSYASEAEVDWDLVDVYDDSDK